MSAKRIEQLIWVFANPDRMSCHMCDTKNERRATKQGKTKLRRETPILHEPYKGEPCDVCKEWTCWKHVPGDREVEGWICKLCSK
jgi:hypothetical protein